MSKRIKRYNHYSYGGHKFSFGSGLTKGIGDFNVTGLGETIGQNIGPIASVAGGIIGSSIGGGYQSNVGNILNTIGNVGAAIPGPWGAAIGAGAKIVGGAVNAAFGTKVNQEALNAANQGTSYLSNFTSNASSFDDIEGPRAVANIGDVYKGGWFAKGKARAKNARLRNQRIAAQDFAFRNVDNNIQNLTNDQTNDMLARYAEFGGPLSIGLYPIGGAIDYEIAQRRLNQKDLELQKALGGPLHTHGDDWTNGVTIINNGGSHESNPLEGVPMGIAPDGEPNLVEEGEVIYNDYVFSNRIKVPDAVRQKYKLRGTKEMTFADAAKKAQKESEERPNDPISQRGLEDIMYKLITEQETIRESKQQREYSEGGKIHIAPSKKGTFTAAASKHGMGVQEFASKVLANPENYSPAMRKKANFARNASKWKHATGGLLDDEPTIWVPGISQLPDVTITPELDIKPLPESALPKFKPFSDGYLEQPPLPPLKVPLEILPPTLDLNQKGSRGSWLTGLRYVPAIGAGLGVFSDLMGWTNTPDYSNANLVLDTANSIGDVSYKPIGDYLTYTPLDRLFYANQLGAQAGATRRGILNTSAGNRGTAIASLLASDYNAQNQLGNLYRQAEEYNAEQRERVATFNRGTNMFNSENALKAAIANRDNAKARISAASHAAALRDAVDARVSAARSANLTNLFDSLGDIGREEYVRNMVMSNPAFPYWVDRQGNVQYKSVVGDKGGFLTIKKRRK